MDTIHSLEQFNSIFRDYIRNYNLTFHTGIQCTPFERYQKTADQAMPVKSREWLDECFLNRVYRKVRRDSTISIDSTCYDVPMQFTGMKVEVRFVPSDMSTAFILYEGSHFPIRMTSACSFFGLTTNPFTKAGNSTKEFFPSNDFKEMHGALGKVKDARGIAVFTSPPGSGKTFVIRVFSKELNPNLYQMIYICLSTVSIAEFYKQLCSALGIPPKGGKPGMFKAIQEQIWYLYKEKRQPLILVIDEAQYLNTAILNDLKMLM